MMIPSGLFSSIRETTRLMVGIVGTVAAGAATFQLQFRCELTTRLYFNCTYARAQLCDKEMKTGINGRLNVRSHSQFPSPSIFPRSRSIRCSICCLALLNNRTLHERT